MHSFWQAALSDRAVRRTKMSVALADLETSRSALTKAQAAPGGKGASAAETDVAEKEQRVAACEESSASISAKVRRDVARFKRDKFVDLRRVLIDYAQLQVAYARKVETAWASLLPDLEALDSLVAVHDHAVDVASSKASVPPPRVPDAVDAPAVFDEDKEDPPLPGPPEGLHLDEKPVVDPLPPAEEEHEHDSVDL
jgi:hypothetical protein